MGAADRFSGPPWRWHLCPQVHAARVRHPGGEADDPDAAGARTWLRTGDRRQPGIIGVPAPGRRPCPRTPGQSRPSRPGPPRCSSKRLPDTSVSLHGITRSDEGGQGEARGADLHAIYRDFRLLLDAYLGALHGSVPGARVEPTARRHAEEVARLGRLARGVDAHVRAGSPDSDSVPASSVENAQTLPPTGRSRRAERRGSAHSPRHPARRGASGQRTSRSSANFSRPSTRNSSSFSAVSVPGCAV